MNIQPYFIDTHVSNSDVRYTRKYPGWASPIFSSWMRGLNYSSVNGSLEIGVCYAVYLVVL